MDRNPGWNSHYSAANLQDLITGFELCIPRLSLSHSHCHCFYFILCLLPIKKINKSTLLYSTVFVNMNQFNPFWTQDGMKSVINNIYISLKYWFILLLYPFTAGATTQISKGMMLLRKRGSVKKCGMVGRTAHSISVFLLSSSHYSPRSFSLFILHAQIQHRGTCLRVC